MKVNINIKFQNQAHTHMPTNTQMVGIQIQNIKY